MNNYCSNLFRRLYFVRINLTKVLYICLWTALYQHSLHFYKNSENIRHNYYIRHYYKLI